MATVLHNERWDRVEDRLYSYTDIAKHLGVRPQTVRSWALIQGLPRGHRIGQSRYISGRVLARWLVTRRGVPRVALVDEHGTEIARYQLSYADDTTVVVLERDPEFGGFRPVSQKGDE